MRSRYENWVEGLNGDWLDQPAALLRRAVPALVPARRRRRGRLRPPDRRRTRRACPIDPTSDVPAGYTEDAARQARRLRRRARRHGHVGDVVADARDRRRLGGRPRPLRPRVPDGPAPPGVSRSSARGCSRPIVRSHFEHDALPWTRRRRSPAGSSTPTARRCRRARATSSRRWSRSAQFGADAMRYWAASGRPGVDTAFDEGQMKVGRRLAIKILNASKFALGVVGDDAARRSTRSPSRSTARCSPPSPRWSPTRPRSFEGYDYARALDSHRAVLLELLRRLPRAGEGSRLRRFRLGARRARRRARHAAAAVRAAHAVRDRRGVVVVARRVRSTARRGRRPTSSRAFGADDLAVYPAASAVLGEIRKAKSEAKRSMRTEVTQA